MDKPLCKHCGETTKQSWGAINRAAKLGKPVYCDRKCAGLAHRADKTPEQKKEEKRLYDMNYRATNPTLKERKAAYHKRTYNPDKAAEHRKKRAPYHAEYCRQPEYRRWKAEYDKVHLARKQYGDFAEAVIALRELEQEVLDTADRTDIYAANGTLNKKQTRRRQYEREQSAEL
jgi:hypothetical protein